jgi:hypothetical protein
LHSWSGAQAYQDVHGVDPFELIRPNLEQAWGKAEQRIVRWSISMRAGRGA